MMRGTFLIAASALMCLTACHPSVTNPSSGMSNDRDPGAAVALDWPFRPRSMSVHPLTRIVRNPGEGMTIELRIELRDRFNHPVKAYGQFRFDLISPHTDPAQRTSFTWDRNLDLRDLSVNQLHYDEITQTYLFRLTLDTDVVVSGSEIRAYYLGDDDADLQAAYSIPGP
jgi:hypothetical protein